MKSSLSRNSTRHPAVIDTLGGAPLPSSAGGPPKPPKSAKAPKPAKSPTAPKAPRPQKDENSGNSHVLRYVAGALVVVSLLGWFLIRTFAGTEAPAPTLAADSSTEPTSAPALAVTPPVETTEPVADPSACRTDTGDQKSGAGVIAAFEHAYYVARSGAAVRALATPRNLFAARGQNPGRNRHRPNGNHTLRAHHAHHHRCLLRRPCRNAARSSASTVPSDDHYQRHRRTLVRRHHQLTTCPENPEKAEHL